MTNAKRGRGFHRGVYFCAAAALGLALSGCGGGSAAVGSAPTAQATTSGLTSPTPASTPPTASTGVTINWTPPTENTDGSALTNLAGYNIHYGTQPGNYTQTITVSNPGIATYVVDNLSPGTYYFAVAAVNSQGAESPLSSPVSTIVN
ncbi:MAG TPA: fibronectin type III domain-containing protein [Steroidobacteraceae bacterium]|nr:fibronectin type III domain-containing protein [Steroidobacteraceae bacterium]